MHEVFISYSKNDSAIADAVCKGLESSGIRCWIAHRDIIAGDWSEAIIDAINESRLMVVLVSSSANESQQVKREVERASSKQITIIPLRIENILPGKGLEYFLGSINWVDAVDPPLKSHIEMLASRARRILSKGGLQEPSDEATSVKEKTTIALVGGTFKAAASNYARKAILIVGCLGVFLAALYFIAAPPNITGEYSGEVLFVKRRLEVNISFRQEGTLISGSYSNSVGDAGLISGNVTGNAFRARMVSQNLPGACELRGEVSRRGSAIDGIYHCTDMEQASFRLNRR